MQRRLLCVAIASVILTAVPAAAQVSFDQDAYVLGMGDSVMPALSSTPAV
jgi:presenilin-like A22 family membrane protease